MNTGDAVRTASPVQRIAFVILVAVLILFLRAIPERQLVAAGYSWLTARNLSYLLVPPLSLVLFRPVLKFDSTFSRLAHDARQLTPRLLAIGVALGVAIRLVHESVPVFATAFGIGPDSSAAFVQWHAEFSCPTGAETSLAVLVMVVLTPLVEEIWHRQWIFNWLLKYGAVAAIIGSTLIFVALHESRNYVLATMFGSLIAALYYRTGNLWPCIVAHGVVNLGAILLGYCINREWVIDTPTAESKVIGLLAGAVIFSAGTLACILVSKRVAGQLTGDPANIPSPTA